MDTDNIVTWDHTASQCELGLFQDADFAGDPAESKSTSGGQSSVYFRKPHVCSTWLVLKTKTAVSHSSVEAEVMSLDAGLRLGGIPALSLWDILTYVSEPQAQGDLMRHSKIQPQTSRNNSVKQ